jgi:hypothetical protein
VDSSDAVLHPLSSDGGLSMPQTHTQDPFEALDDLMQVIEALCPTWPRRELFPDTAASAAARPTLRARDPLPTLPPPAR